MISSYLKSHPFAVEASFEHSLVLTYAVPAAELRELIPECLELDLYEDKWAFLALAMVKTKDLRPKGFPALLGHDFVLTGYRVFVKYTTSEGKRLRGLYILKSETDKKRMQWLGNLFTHYNYGTTDMDFSIDGESMQVRSLQSDLDIAVAVNDPAAALPATAPFKNWKEARRFAGPLPFTFTYDAASGKVLIIEGVRENWIPQPVGVIRSHAGFIQQLGLKEICLANAFLISNIPYYWKKGRTDIWKQ